MKKVETMKRAIKESNTNGGYKWTASASGIRWGYLDILFSLIIDDKMVKLTDGYEECVAFVVSEDDMWLVDSPYNHHEFEKTYEDAIYWVTRKMISKAEYLY